MDSPHLLSLAERVETASGPSLVLDRDIALTQYPDARALPNNDARISVWDGNGRTQLTVKPYTASLDAAMTLVDAEWFWRVGHDGEGADPSMFRADIGDPISFGFVKAIAATPALALCAAALRALSQSHSQTERGEA